MTLTRGELIAMLAVNYIIQKLLRENESKLDMGVARHEHKVIFKRQIEFTGTELFILLLNIFRAHLERCNIVVPIFIVWLHHLQLVVLKAIHVIFIIR